jgi:hypothetical protein
VNESVVLENEDVFSGYFSENADSCGCDMAGASCEGQLDQTEAGSESL